MMLLSLKYWQKNLKNNCCEIVFWIEDINEGYILKVFMVERIEGITWCMDYKAVIIAEDELHAERFE